MKHYLFFIFLITNLFMGSISGQTSLDSFLSDFDYQSRKDMKVSSEQMVHLLTTEEAVLVDIRFEEEQSAWQFNDAVFLPLPLLPERYGELPKDKLIVTACPHKDRAIIAMVYLRAKGYEVAYLKDGLLALAEHLRGDRARDFIEKKNHK